MIPLYCNGCGTYYIKVVCGICNLVNEICGCDGTQNTCDEHNCIKCGEPYADLNDDGMCLDCVEIIEARKK